MLCVVFVFVFYLFFVLLILFWVDIFQVICYYDVLLVGSVQVNFDDISVCCLVDYFEWLEVNGYKVIFVQDLIDVCNGSCKLLFKVVLLIFDDGYVSFYKFVFLLFKVFCYLVILVVVGFWLEQDGKVSYGGCQVE